MLETEEAAPDCTFYDPIELLPRGQAVQVFRMRAEHTLLRDSMFRTKWTSEPLVARADLSSNRLPMSCFRARPWRWSEIHLCSWKAIS